VTEYGIGRKNLLVLVLGRTRRNPLQLRILWSWDQDADEFLFDKGHRMGNGGDRKRRNTWQ